MQIQLENFMDLSIDVVEIDSNPPSMKLDVKMTSRQGETLVTYASSAWCVCYVWDGFVSSLKNLPNFGADFCTVRGDFFLKVEREFGRKFFLCGFKSQDPSIPSSWFCGFRGEISEAGYADIVKKFPEVSRQWADKAAAQADLAGMKVKGEA